MPSRATWVAVVAGEIVAVLVVHAGYVEQLYVLAGQAGRGIGSALIDLAKRQSPAGLRLYTFQINDGARRFYERHGFRALAFSDGSENEEGEPDVLYGWPAGV